MQPILPTPPAMGTNAPNSSGADDTANQPGAVFQFVPAGQANYPQNLDYLTWNKSQRNE